MSSHQSDAGRSLRDVIEYRTVDKSTWERGPWDDEPDKRQWTDAATGLPCLLVRHQTSGHYCGYVGVGPDHPLHGVGYNTCRLPTKCETSFCDHTPESILSAHGGITFASACRHGDDPSVGVCHIPQPGQPEMLGDCRSMTRFLTEALALSVLIVSVYLVTEFVGIVI